MKSESVDRKIWLTNPPILHTISYEKPQFITTQSKCLQPKIYENILLKSLKKTKKRNQKAFDQSFLNITGRGSTLTHTCASHTMCPERRRIDFHRTDFKNGMKLTAKKGTGDFKLKLS